MVPTYENRPEDLDVYENRTLTFPPHLHEGVELFYVESGAITVTCAGCTRTLYPGWMAVIFPNAIHSYLTDPGEKNGHFLFAICHPRLAGEALRTLTHFEPENPFLPPDAVHPDMVYALRALRAQSRGERSPAVCAALTQLNLAHAFTHLSLRRPAESAPYDLTARAIAYINQNIAKPLTLGQVAQAIGSSKYYLSRHFSPKLGMGFSDDVGSLRVRQAQGLLRATDRKIAQISLDCGFENQRTFNRTFLRHCALTPRAYRERQG